MSKWAIRVTGLILMTLGGFLFVYSVAHISSQWPRIFVGLASIFFTAMGFGVLIMPLDSANYSASKDDSSPP
ncbi:MAG: hypothetical protein ACE5E9_06945 [Nitrospinaceae bacterium]